MSILTRKQFSFSQENLHKLRELTCRYGVSESELVRRAITAYDPEKASGPPTQDELERDIAVAILNQITNAARSALESVECSNQKVTKALILLNDPVQREAIAAEARREITENPGFLDEIADLI